MLFILRHILIVFLCGINDFTITNEGCLKIDKDGATLTVTFTGTSLKMWTFGGHSDSVLEYTVDGGEIKGKDFSITE